MLIISAILVYAVFDLYRAVRRKEAVGVMAALAVAWATAASWTTVTALRGDIPAASWTALNAYSTAVAYVPLIALGLGLALGDVAASLTVNHKEVKTKAGAQTRRNANLAIMHDNHSALVALWVLPILAVIGTAVAFGISLGLIQPVDGLPASVVHDFGITHNTTTLHPGWSAFQHEVRSAFIHTVFGATALALAFFALVSGGVFAFVVGKLIRRR